MVTTIAEHSVDLSLLPKEADVIDLGCLGMEFTDKMRERGNFVWSVDIQDIRISPEPGMITLDPIRCAITDYTGKIGIQESSDLQAFRTKHGDEIPCYTLKDFMKEWVESDFVGLIKMDVEGDEYKIIMSLDKAPAKQLSIEFHLHTGIYGQSEMRMMEDKLEALGYRAISHNYEARHCAGLNYWDSLWILK